MKVLRVAVIAGLLVATLVAEAVAATTVTGTLTLKLTITIASTVPTTTPILCTFGANVAGNNATITVFDNISESDTVTATRSGSTAVCLRTIPYQWTLLVLASDKVSLDYSVTATDADGRGRSTSNQFFATMTVPATGKTTPFVATARI